MIAVLALLWPLLGDQAAQPKDLQGSVLLYGAPNSVELCRWKEGTGKYQRSPALKGRSCKGIYRFLTTHSGTMPYWELCWVADPCMAPPKLKAFTPTEYTTINTDAAITAPTYVCYDGSGKAWPEGTCRSGSSTNGNTECCWKSNWQVEWR